MPHGVFSDISILCFPGLSKTGIFCQVYAAEPLIKNIFMKSGRGRCILDWNVAVGLDWQMSVVGHGERA